MLSFDEKLNALVSSVEARKEKTAHLGAATLFRLLRRPSCEDQRVWINKLNELEMGRSSRWTLSTALLAQG